MTIWHDNTEIPKHESDCFYIVIDSFYDKNGHFKEMREKLRFGKFRRDIIDLFILDENVTPFSHVKKWAYEEDIIKSAFKEPIGYAIKLNKPERKYYFHEHKTCFDEQQIVVYINKEDAKSACESCDSPKPTIVPLYD
jgi:hypothetical protein